MDIDVNYQLNSRYTRGLDEPPGRIYMSGTQALVRLVLAQAAVDRSAGRKTAGFVTGYRGSPLGAVDKEMWRAAKNLKNAGIRFQPAINEDLAATAIIGTQKVETDPTRRVDGVFSLWYGKGPGIDRSGDALKHGNAYGSSPTGGVLIVAGDDHGCVSSSMSHQSDLAMMAWYLPIIHPSSIADYVECGLWGWALSRFSGTWVGFKAVSETVESSASVPSEVVSNFVQPEIDPGPDGLHWRWPDLPGQQIERRLEYKLAAVKAFAKANPLDKLIIDPESPRVLIAAVGKAYGDVKEALDSLGIQEQKLKDKGIALLKVNLVYPLSPALKSLAEQVDEVLIVEEKESVVEALLKQDLYNIAAENRPIVRGKNGEELRLALPRSDELRPSKIALALSDCLERYGLNTKIPDKWKQNEGVETLPAPVSLVKTDQDIAVVPIKTLTRTPYFCSGCPHNSSTRVPEGSRAQLGIGCHAMAVHMERNTSGSVQMGGEGVDWVGQSPYVEEAHIFQNLGDGTFSHSGHLAIRQAVAADATITYKILYNDAVAMTGGQPVDVQLSVPQICRILTSEGVQRIVVVADDPKKYSVRTTFPVEVSIRHRDDLDRVQRELRKVQGVTVIIYDQVCATEDRRRRRRDNKLTRKKTVVINELVCEGCGDCQVKSNCLSVVPVDTLFGRKRKIDQASCNTDLSCLKGFCPSFVTIEGISGQSVDERLGDQEEIIKRALACPAPELGLNGNQYNLLIAGVGGTGVVTVGSLIAMAAHLQGLGVSVLDFTGFAQKGGSVLSHVRLASAPHFLNQTRIDKGGADALLVMDLVVATQKDALAMLLEGQTKVVASVRETQVGSMLRNPDARIDTVQLERVLVRKVGSKAYRRLSIEHIARKLVNPLQENVLSLGFAWQSGLVPVSLDALMRAVELNGAEIDENKCAFAWGRLLAADPGYVEGIVGDLSEAPSEHSLDDLIIEHASFLEKYQNANYANRYRQIVERARVAGREIGKESIGKTVARSAFKLMAYKDEYEVARLLSSSDFINNIKQTYGRKARLSFHLAPPALSFWRKSDDEPEKITIGGWVLPVLRSMGRLKVLRGTIFDVFGYTKERKSNRKLINDYDVMLENILPELSLSNYHIAEELASLPLFVRGYGSTMLLSMNRMLKRKTALMEDFFSQPLLNMQFTIENKQLSNKIKGKKPQIRADESDVLN